MTRRASAWEIIVVDTNPKRWPAASKLVAAGVPLKVALDYKRLRRDMTVGLRRRVADAKN